MKEEVAPNVITIGDISIVSNEGLDKVYSQIKKVIGNKKISSYLLNFKQEQFKKRMLGIS